MEERRREEHHVSEGREEDLWDRDETADLTEELGRDARKRHIMLFCACLLGLGSLVPSFLGLNPSCDVLDDRDRFDNRHFGAYVLGPIKSSLKTSESAFASLIASFELLNTVTPLLSGFLVPR